ncbi:hypothetical protein [Rhodovulum marinum]|uniref:Uncharacterized protein n=1 Tax=Rhodovulum marinum TaxID=320662 RepID=A0A4R2Q5N3_9RHOB|nr:hypothetical protein [Rhodovulum marinum]TCP43960.1 hypothetical protein EV662_10144 [Rhodovulum marinum]
MGKSNAMKALEDRLSRIRSEMEKLRIQEELVLDMMREERGEPAPKKRAKRANVKRTVLDLLTAVGAGGLNAAIAVDMAAKDGVELERGSVSSLLSRLKNEGTVTYDGEVYRLKEHSNRGGEVHPLRLPGATMR